MLIIAFFVVVIEKTGFLLTEDIEDIIYVKEEGEQSSVKPKQKKAKGETKEGKETEKAKPKPKPKAEPKPKQTDLVLDENFEDVLQPNITAVADNVSLDFQSEVFSNPSLSLDYDSISDFANEILKDAKEGWYYEGK